MSVKVQHRDATDPRCEGRGSVVVTPDVETLGLLVPERLHELLERHGQLLEQLLKRHLSEFLGRDCHDATPSAVRLTQEHLP